MNRCSEQETNLARISHEEKPKANTHATRQGAWGQEQDVRTEGVTTHQCSPLCSRISANESNTAAYAGLNRWPVIVRWSCEHTTKVMPPLWCRGISALQLQHNRLMYEVNTQWRRQLNRQNDDDWISLHLAFLPTHTVPFPPIIAAACVQNFTVTIEAAVYSSAVLISVRCIYPP